MDISHCTYEDLAFPTLLRDYTTNFDQLSAFYEYNPFDKDSVKIRASIAQKTVERESLISALSEYHEHLEIAAEQKVNLEKLANPASFTVVTGQQLGITGGPLFTIYKTLTAILHARKWEKELGAPVVPVFWMADEDHDFEEIASFYMPLGNQSKEVAIENDTSGRAVAEVFLDDIDPFINELSDLLQPTDFKEEISTLIQHCYANGHTHAQAFGKLMSKIFSPMGVIIAGSNHKAIKSLLVDVIETSIKDRADIHDRLDKQTELLEQNYHRQVQIGSTNLFHFDEEGRRVKFQFKEASWVAGEKSFSEDELLDLARSKPEQFSPNVFLRPVMQDRLLPTLAYVAGPGELAYYAQMKTFYGAFNQSMPIIMPRLSFSLVESGIQKAMESLPFGFTSYKERIEQLEKQFVEHTQETDWEDVFNDWKSGVNQQSESYIRSINDLDASLKASSERAVTVFSTELDKLKGKIIKSVKQKQETQINRIRKVKTHLFPENSLQERHYSFLYFMNKYGMDIWKDLYQAIEKEQLGPDQHHIVYL